MLTYPPAGAGEIKNSFRCTSGVNIDLESAAVHHTDGQRTELPAERLQEGPVIPAQSETDCGQGSHP
jgi:hypothetical protein